MVLTMSPPYIARLTSRTWWWFVKRNARLLTALDMCPYFWPSWSPTGIWPRILPKNTQKNKTRVALPGGNKYTHPKDHREQRVERTAVLTANMEHGKAKPLPIPYPNEHNKPWSSPDGKEFAEPENIEKVTNHAPEVEAGNYTPIPESTFPEKN